MWVCRVCAVGVRCVRGCALCCMMKNIVPCTFVHSNSCAKNVVFIASIFRVTSVIDMALSFYAPHPSVSLSHSHALIPTTLSLFFRSHSSICLVNPPPPPPAPPRPQVPRITRAQKMDTLSSQANLSGYRAVIEALAVFPRFSKAQVTAAGKVAPCTVLVIGAGVAGMCRVARRGESMNASE